MAAPLTAGSSEPVWRSFARRAGFWRSRAEYWATAPAAELGRFAPERMLVVATCTRRAAMYRNQARRLLDIARRTPASAGALAHLVPGAGRRLAGA